MRSTQWGARMGVPFISPKLAVAAMGEDAFPNRTKDADFCTNNVAFHDAKSHTLHVGVLRQILNFQSMTKNCFLRLEQSFLKALMGKYTNMMLSQTKCF